MRLEKDLARIRRLAEEREDENWRFRTFLKGQDGEEMDGIVHAILAEVAPHIDCTACANCCCVMQPVLEDADITRLADGLSLREDAFQEAYTEEQEEFGETYLVLKGKPCVFLKDKKCTVYAHRPEACRSYPHLHKDEFISRLMGVVSRYGVCPIVFNVYERLKEDVWPRRKWRRT